VNTPLWSDNAGKRRWLAVPNDGTANSAQERIAFASDREWQFPSGTVFIKHFDLPIDDTNPAITRRLETRFLVIDQNGGSYGVTYRWRSDGSDADLLATGATQDYTIATAGGGTRTQTWSFPSRIDCTSCHNPNAKHVLGVKTHQLNRDFVYSATGRTDNQLRTLGHLGLLDGFSEAQLANYPKARALGDASASIEVRARSYLDANCAQCHRPGGARANFDARFTSPLEQQNLLYGVPNDTINGPTDRYIRPQDLTHSLIYERAGRVGNLQMPPLAKNVVDTAAMQVLAAWINTLTPAPALYLSRLPATNAAFTAGPFGVRAQFTEPVAGLTSGMFTTANCAISGLSGSGATYDFTVQPQLEGAVAVQLPTNSVQGNYASNILSAIYDAHAAGLETWLPFDDASGLTAMDASGFGNHGLLQNMGAENWIVGANGTGLDFNGVDEYVAIGNVTTLDFTLACWIRTTQVFPQATPTYGGAGILWSDIGGDAQDFILGANRSGTTGVNRLSFFTGSSAAAGVTLNGTIAINTGDWVHIAATRNGTTGQMKIFVNGALNGTATGSTGLLHANEHIHIGGNTLDGRYFAGQIDDVRIYSRALAESEVAALAARTAPREDYAAWAARTMASLPAAQRAAEADGDGDGWSNFSEFAFWLDPLHADPQPHQFVRGADGAPRLIFRRRLYAGDLGYVIHLSPDLQTWFPAGSDLLLESIVRPAGENYEIVTMRFQSADPELQQRAFVKIEAQQAAP
jgi:mono/diheme cytochrome c family protein